MFLVYDGYCFSRKAVHSWVANVSLMAEKLKRGCRSGWDNSQKTSILWVWTHWWSDGTSVSVLVEDMSRNKCFFFFPGSNITFFTFYISICDLFTDSPRTFNRIRIHRKPPFPNVWHHCVVCVSSHPSASYQAVVQVVHVSATNCSEQQHYIV
jgi:hypothetical protein